jgi:hypothetical protein
MTFKMEMNMEVKYKTVELGHISFSGKSIHCFCDELRALVMPMGVIAENVILCEVEGKENVGLIRVVQRVKMSEDEVRDARVKEMREKFNELGLKIDGMHAEWKELSEKLKSIESSVKAVRPEPKYGVIY